MTEFGPTSNYLGIKVSIFIGKVIITQKTCIGKLLDSYEITNCNFLPMLIIKKLSLKPRQPDFTPNIANVTAYKKFIGFVQ